MKQSEIDILIYLCYETPSAKSKQSASVSFSDTYIHLFSVTPLHNLDLQSATNDRYFSFHHSERNPLDLVMEGLVICIAGTPTTCRSFLHDVSNDLSIIVVNGIKNNYEYRSGHQVGKQMSA